MEIFFERRDTSKHTRFHKTVALSSFVTTTNISRTPHVEKKKLPVTFNKAILHEGGKLLIPPPGFESGRRIARDEEKGAHGVHVAERRLTLRHLQGRVAQRPQVTSVNGRGRGILKVVRGLAWDACRREEADPQPSPGP